MNSKARSTGTMPASGYQRSTAQTDDFDPPPPPYTEVGDNHSEQNDEYNHAALKRDPRSSSSHSLLPSQSEPLNDRRTLLLIYIHGFMGSGANFQSFPAHVHNLLATLISDSHVVHTKVYPRYHSKKHINFARDDFSRWLAPHEGPDVDVILCGHSMGGFLSAEVALMGDDVRRSLQHRLLGTVNYDVPFLGMHPGVVRSGLSSIFMPAQAPAPEPTASGSSGANAYMQQGGSLDGSPLSGLRSPGGSVLELPSAPNYNPAFPNDPRVSTRTGWQNALHFVSKHSDHLLQGTKQLITSHLEFGGAMADYGAMKRRYARIRALEEENGAVRKSVVGDLQTPPRVRFINYYTASHGRPKPPKPVPEAEAASSGNTELKDTVSTQTAPTGNHDATAGGSDELRLALEDVQASSTSKESEMSAISPLSDGTFSDDDSVSSLHSDQDSKMETLEPRHYDGPVSEDESTVQDEISTTDDMTSHEQASEIARPSASLPPLPALPEEPKALDLPSDTKPDVRKVAEKDFARATKAYQKAVKNNDKALRDRAKLDEKWLKKQQASEEKRKRREDKATRKTAKGKGSETKKSDQNDGSKDAEHKMTPSATSSIDPPIQSLQDLNLAKEPSAAVRSSVSSLATISTNPADTASLAPTESTAKDDNKPPSSNPKSPKDRHFCTLPPADSAGNRDPKWVRVFMANVDEVGAHCGLFFSSRPDYEALVWDVAERVQGWVGEAEGERVAREMSAESPG